MEHAPDIHEFDDAGAWAGACADALAKGLRDAIEGHGHALIALSGGGTPGPIIERLAGADLDWAKVTATGTDDRVVAEDHPARNLAMIRDRLGPALAKGAHVAAVEALPADAAPDAVLLGFGGDSHIASIFPAGEGMDAANAPDAPAVVRTIPEPLPPEAPFARATLSFRALAAAPVLAIAAKGAGKRAVFDAAMAGMAAGETPLARILAGAQTRPHLYWLAD